MSIIRINTQEDIPTATQKRMRLKESLNTIREYLMPMFIDEMQYERFVDFEMEVLAIADAEISYAEHIFRLLEDMDR